MSDFRIPTPTSNLETLGKRYLPYERLYYQVWDLLDDYNELYVKSPSFLEAGDNTQEAINKIIAEEGELSLRLTFRLSEREWQLALRDMICFVALDRRTRDMPRVGSAVNTTIPLDFSREKPTVMTELRKFFIGIGAAYYHWDNFDSMDFASLDEQDRKNIDEFLDDIQADKEFIVSLREILRKVSTPEIQQKDLMRQVAVDAARAVSQGIELTDPSVPPRPEKTRITSMGKIRNPDIALVRLLCQDMDDSEWVDDDEAKPSPPEALDHWSLSGNPSDQMLKDLFDKVLNAASRVDPEYEDLSTHKVIPLSSSCFESRPIMQFGISSAVELMIKPICRASSKMMRPEPTKPLGGIWRLGTTLATHPFSRSMLARLRSAYLTEKVPIGNPFDFSGSFSKARVFRKLTRA